MDDRIQFARELMGGRLRRLLEQKGITVSKLARESHRDRGYIIDILEGRANVGLDLYAELVSACGTDFEEFLVGFVPESVNPSHAPFHSMLKTILDADVRDLTHGIRVNLEAISEKAERLIKARGPQPRARAPVLPTQRAGEGDRAGVVKKATGRRRK